MDGLTISLSWGLPVREVKETGPTTDSRERDYINLASRYRLPTGLAQHLDDLEEQVHERPTSFRRISASTERSCGWVATLGGLLRFAVSPGIPVGPEIGLE
jgi:hypothetical protein